MTIDLGSLISATDLNRNSGQILARAASGERIVVLSQNRPHAAIISIADLHRLQGLVDLAADTAGEDGVQPMSGAAGTTTIGRTQSGEPAVLRLACNTLIAGRTGTGKSSTLIAAMAAACVDPDAPPRLLVGLRNGGDFAFAESAIDCVVSDDAVDDRPSISDIICRTGDNPAAADNLKGELLGEQAWRQGLLRSSGAASIAELRAGDLSKRASAPDLIVAIDELPSNSGNELDWWQFLSELIRDGEKLGIYLWLTSQPGALSRMGLPDIKRCFPQRIVHYVGAEWISNALVGVDGSAMLRSLKVGQAVVQPDVGPAQWVTITEPGSVPAAVTGTSTG